MTEEPARDRSLVDQYFEKLKSKIPRVEHGALESRLEELLNDATADDDDVIVTLQQEFDPERAR